MLVFPTYTVTDTMPSWSWLNGSWTYNYLCNQCLSPLKLWVRIPLGRGVLDTTLFDKVCQWLATGRWFSPGTPVSFTHETDRHNTTELSLKVALTAWTWPQPTPGIKYIHFNRYDQYILELRTYTATDTINIFWYYLHTLQQIRQIYFGITYIHCNWDDKNILV
jgi:hypothetical protein